MEVNSIQFMYKFYAIKNLKEEGYITENYRIFEEMIKNSKGLKVQGKGFKTEEEAKYFLDSPVYLRNKKFIAYTDGSYDVNTKKCSYGYIIFNNRGEAKYKYSHMIQDNTGLHNVMGELKAVMMAVKMARQLRVKMDIYYDFTGVESLLLLKKTYKDRKHSSFINSYIQFMQENRFYYTLKYINSSYTKYKHTYVHNMVKRELKSIT